MMETELQSLEEMQAEFEALRRPFPHGDYDQVTAMQILGRIRAIFSTPGLLERIHEYQIGLAEKE